MVPRCMEPLNCKYNHITLKSFLTFAASIFDTASRLMLQLLSGGDVNLKSYEKYD